LNWPKKLKIRKFENVELWFEYRILVDKLKN
jgi:hypothetical protein